MNEVMPAAEGQKNIEALSWTTARGPQKRAHDACVSRGLRGLCIEIARQDEATNLVTSSYMINTGAQRIDGVELAQRSLRGCGHSTVRGEGGAELAQKSLRGGVCHANTRADAYMLRTLRTLVASLRTATP